MRMNKSEYIIERFAKTEMQKWGLSPDLFTWGNAVRQAGSCRFTKNGNKWVVVKITISRKLLAARGVEETKNTVLHEIAHALAGHEAGHNNYWKQWARRVGARPERCYSLDFETVKTISKYVAKCKNGCDYSYPFNRFTAKWQRNVYRCPKCTGDLKVIVQ